MADNQKLTGGNSNSVTKQGNTVIRDCGEWSPFIHQLLQYLEKQGFAESPRFLKTDGNIETLTFIEGDAGNDPLKPSMQADNIVIESAQLLREYHDVTQGFSVSQDAKFFLPIRENMTQEVICHNDFAPYNCVFKDGHIVGIIDFDTASPGERLWDIAYAVYRFVPLMNDSHCRNSGWKNPPDRAKRLKLFCDSYGLDNRDALIETVIHRLEALISYMQETSSNLEHIPLYRDDIAYIQLQRQFFENALT